MQFAAIQLNEGETAHQAIEALMKTALATKSAFSNLEVLGMMTIGTAKYVRFRTDLFGLTTLKVMLQQGRGVVWAVGGEYKVHRPDGKEGPIGASTMLANPLPGEQRSYRGPSLQHWDRQFL